MAPPCQSPQHPPPTWVSVSVNHQTRSAGKAEGAAVKRPNSCVSRQTAVCARFLPLHQRGGRKGLSPVTLLSPVFWNRTWRTMRMEPRPLRSRMGEPAPGTPSSSLCTIPQDAITTPIPKGPLAHLPLSPRRAHSSCRDSGRTSVRSSQWSFSTISSSTQRSYNACCSVDPDRRGTGGGPLARCLQRHLFRARLPVAGPGSLPRDLHLLRGQGTPGLPVLLPALLREVSRRRRTAGSIVGAERPRAASSRP
ncbi:transmembrane protein 134 isoform X2 [Neophocaena asiaeorientalis asiaeorientalis]|uniref:Transmembrane protein 134 isoform X2 n=1 Tax=Neophocaena asiaeorientalis asiaeorientalis TaxID=1706337 RepID=A0A341BSV1_NEOAA|nr:transmembrane protein 134 isoform X2 [Neophocaena asiaeorientalis asiaeorientalis]